MIKLALKRPVATVVVFLAITFTGLIAFQDLSLSLFPSFDLPELTVVTEYSGATPVEVEEYITKTLEQAVTGVSGVRRVNSTSRENLSVIRVQFDWGTDMEYATLNLREKLDSARMRQGFPEDADRPTILKWNPASSPIMGLFVSSGESTSDLTEFLDTAVKQRLEGIDGVSAINLKGGLDKEVILSFDSRKLAFYNLTTSDIARAVADYNQDASGGVIKKSSYRYSLRIVSSLTSLEDIEQVPVKKNAGSIILLKDVASVNWGSPDPTALSRMNGKTGVLVLIYKTVSANTLETIDKVTAALSEFERDFPGYTFQVAFENSRLIKMAISNVIQTIAFGGILAFFMIIFFLGNFRAPLVISISIPVSIIATFALMFFKGVNLNIMSLSGLALGVGMLVDNSIVVLESIVKHKEKGMPHPALSGTKEVAGAVTASTLTTISVFLPLMFVHGIAGNIFRDQSLTVSFSLVCSLLVSLTLLPVVARMTLTQQKGQDTSLKPSYPSVPLKRWLWGFPYYILKYLMITLWAGVKWLMFAAGMGISALAKLMGAILYVPMKGFTKGYDAVFSGYHALLVRLLDRKALLFSVSFVLLTAGLFSGSRLHKEFFPKTQSEYLAFTMELPKNASIEASLNMSESFDAYLNTIPQIHRIVSVIGVDPSDLSSVNEDSGTHYLNYTLKFTGDEDRIKSAVLAFLKQRQHINVVFKKEDNEMAMLMKTSEATIKFISNSRTEATDVAGRALNFLKSQQDVLEVTDNFTDSGSDGLQILFKKDALLKYGIRGSALGEFIQTAIRGKTISTLKLTDRNFLIRLRLTPSKRETISQLLSTVYLHNGISLKLSELIEVEHTLIPEKLEREQQNPLAVLQVVLAPGTDREAFMTSVLPQIETLKQGESVIIEEGQEMKDMRDSLKSLIMALILSFVLVYLLLSAQFESFKLPFVIIFTFPMGLAGAFLALTATGMTLNILSAVGLVILTGIVVNDAIVKVDCIQQKVEQNIPLRQAVLEGSHDRFRPIWMTTLTTVLAMVPVFFIEGAGSDLLKPLSVVLIGGLLMATTLTLFLIPAIYEVMYKKKVMSNE